VNNLAHLNSSEIGASASENVVIDALYFSDTAKNIIDIPTIIFQRFGINMPDEIISSIIDRLLIERKLDIVDSNCYILNGYIRAELTKNKAIENEIRGRAVEIWLNNPDIFQSISVEQRDALENSIDIFLDKVFVIHGAASFKLIGSTISHEDFDIASIADEVSQIYSKHKSYIQNKLPSIFTLYSDSDVISYLKLKINKAIAYLSAVMPKDIHASICDRLNGTIIYLDTSVLYRLLNLQGENRYFSVKNAIELCQKNGAIFKVSAETYTELKTRIKYDSKVLIEHPIRTDLAAFGYKYRTSDNYVSSYWERTAKTGISVADYNSFYSNVDIVLSEEHKIEIEQTTVDEEFFLKSVEDFYSKINLFDAHNEKSPNSAWHDAYCLAYVKKQQLRNVSVAIDTKCLFLTTDTMLIKLQEKDSELKENASLVLTPSQLVQIFSFTTNAGDYVETFASLFSSASIGRNKSLYTNDDIQEILSRISHYNSYSPSISEKVLENQLLSDKFKSSESDSEKEELIYNEISSVLLQSIEQSENKNTELEYTNKLLEQVIQQNETIFSEFRTDIDAKESIIQNQQTLINKQCNTHVNDKWNRWLAGHIICIVVGIGLVFTCLGLIVYVVRDKGVNLGDWTTIIQLSFSVVFLGVAIPLIKFGFKACTPNIKSTIKEQYKNEYLSNLQTATTPN